MVYNVQHVRCWTGYVCFRKSAPWGRRTCLVSENVKMSRVNRHWFSGRMAASDPMTILARPQDTHMRPNEGKISTNGSGVEKNVRGLRRWLTTDSGRFHPTSSITYLELGDFEGWHRRRPDIHLGRVLAVRMPTPACCD